MPQAMPSTWRMPGGARCRRKRSHRGDTFLIPNEAKAHRGQEQQRGMWKRWLPVMPPTRGRQAVPEEDSMSLGAGKIRFNQSRRTPPYPEANPDGSLMGWQMGPGDGAEGYTEKLSTCSFHSCMSPARVQLGQGRQGPRTGIPPTRTTLPTLRQSEGLWPRTMRMDW